MATTIGSSTQKTLLTDRYLKGLKAAPPGKRVVVWDTVVPGFGVRVSDRGDAAGKAAGLSFIVMRRRPGEAQPIRYTIGRYHPDALPLAKAREEARKALGLIAGGTKPLDEKRRQRHEQAERRANTVGALVEDFIADMRRRGLRNANEFEAIIRREFLGELYRDGQWIDGKEISWRERPVAEITAQEAARLIKGIINRGKDPEPGQRRRKSGGPWAAHHALAIGKTMFEWAIAQLSYGTEASPFERIKPQKLIGTKQRRRRVLSDDEIRYVWKAADQIGGPYGEMVKLLILTGQRLSQAAELQAAEIDLDKALWITPAEKMKMGKAHATPLAPAAVDLLRERLDGLRAGDFVFSTTAGARPISGFSKFKKRLDKLLEQIRREQVADGEPSALIPNWTIHDLRRSVRSELPALGVSDVVAEAILAHARPGIAGTCDRYDYLAEKRHALTRWAAYVRAVVDLPPANVVPMRSRR